MEHEWKEQALLRAYLQALEDAMANDPKVIMVPLEPYRLRLQYRDGEPGYHWDISAEQAYPLAQGYGRDIVDTYDQVLLFVHSSTLVALDKAVVGIGMHHPPAYR